MEEVHRLNHLLQHRCIGAQLSVFGTKQNWIPGMGKNCCATLHEFLVGGKLISKTERKIKLLTRLISLALQSIDISCIAIDRYQCSRYRELVEYGSMMIWQKFGSLFRIHGMAKNCCATLQQFLVGGKLIPVPKINYGCVQN